MVASTSMPATTYRGGKTPQSFPEPRTPAERLEVPEGPPFDWDWHEAREMRAAARSTEEAALFTPQDWADMRAGKIWWDEAVDRHRKEP